MILSSFTTTSMEDVVKTSRNGLLWLQLMLTLPNDLIKEHIIQAEKLGYKVLVITVDQPNVGLPRDNSHIFDMELTTFPSLKFLLMYQLSNMYLIIVFYSLSHGSKH